MPKMRTHKGTQKRFKLSANGVVMRAKGQKSHMRRRKPNRVKQLYNKSLRLDESLATHVHAALPYGLPKD